MRRGQAPLVGLVLLIGMAATISVGTFVIANEATSSIEDQSEQERLETAFVELRQELSTTTTADGSRTIDFDLGGGEALVREETADITITSEGLPDGSFDGLTMGSIEYEHDDGTVLAYEGGAVFRHTDDETTVVSPPSISYEWPTQTLTMPVITTGGADHLSSGDVRLSPGESTAFTDAAVVENQSVSITIESEFYRGWASVFSEQAGETSVQAIDHENETVEIEIGYADIEGAFGTGVTYAKRVDDFNDEFGDDARQASLPPMDDVIDDLLTETQRNESVTNLSTISGGEELTGGLYHADEVELDSSGDSVVADLEENATLVVDGDFLMDHNNAEWLVDSPDEETVLRIYVTGNFELQNGEMKPESGNAEHLQVYGTSQLDAHFHDGFFHGTFYAASDEWDGTNEVSDQCDDGEFQVCFHSDPEFEGALVAHSSDIHADASQFTYDTSLEGSEFDAYPPTHSAPPQLTYLNVAKYELDIES